MKTAVVLVPGSVEVLLMVQGSMAPTGAAPVRFVAFEGLQFS